MLYWKAFDMSNNYTFWKSFFRICSTAMYINIIVKFGRDRIQPELSESRNREILMTRDGLHLREVFLFYLLIMEEKAIVSIIINESYYSKASLNFESLWSFLVIINWSITWKIFHFCLTQWDVKSRKKMLLTKQDCVFDNRS